MRLFFQIVILIALLMASTSGATVHRIEAGDGTISAALPLATAGDTLMLITSGGIYSESKNLDIEIPNLTIMAAPNLANPPVWTANGTKILEVHDTIKLEGIHFDGDLRWTGQASLIADQQNFARSWRPLVGGGLLFIILTFVVYQLAHWRLRERTEHRMLERTRTELEAHVTERTNALHATNDQLQREIAERRYVEQALRQARDELESIVNERTQELQSTKENLQELDEQLRQSQKLEAIGQLAGGIAHDFNNQLAIIRGYVDMVIDQVSPNTRIHDQLNHISQAVIRSSKLTGQLLMFSSKQPVETRALDLNQTISDLQSMFDRLLGEDIAVRLDLQEDVWTVFADAGNLDQVLTNLAVNARDAMPEGGVLTIRTRNVELDVRESMHWPEAKPGSYVCFSISDTGVGMDAETKARLFEPFFTTKGPGKGTGLGLSVVYGIVQAHGGWIDVATELGKGTVFSIYLPAFDGTKEEKPQTNIAKSHDQLQGHGEHILLVEDETALREMKTQILSTRNYEVIACESLEETLNKIENDNITFDLLLSDVVLPDGRGTDLAYILTQDHPNLPVVLVTGYTDERADWDRAQEAGWPILQKPVSVSKLLESIREALDSPDYRR